MLTSYFHEISVSRLITLSFSVRNKSKEKTSKTPTTKVLLRRRFFRRTAMADTLYPSNVVRAHPYAIPYAIGFGQIIVGGLCIVLLIKNGEFNDNDACNDNGNCNDRSNDNGNVSSQYIDFCGLSYLISGSFILSASKHCFLRHVTPALICNLLSLIISLIHIWLKRNWMKSSTGQIAVDVYR